jgi:hypothetical protein
MARLHGAMLDTPTLGQALRELYRRDDAPCSRVGTRVSNEELREYLRAQGLTLKLRDSDFRARSPTPLRGPT